MGENESQESRRWKDAREYLGKAKREEKKKKDVNTDDAKRDGCD